MIEQFSLFEEAPTSDTLPARLETVLESARDKYSYHKMHTSGMYEMIKNAPSSELYEIMELRALKDKSLAFMFDSQLYLKFVPKKERVCMTKDIYQQFLQGAPAQELKGNESPKGGVCVEIPFAVQIEFFSNAIDYLVKTIKPTARFSCCSKFLECSAKKTMRSRKCVLFKRL